MERGLEDSPSQLSEGTNPAWHLDHGVLASRAVRQYISVFKPSSLWSLVTMALTNTIITQPSELGRIWSPTFSFSEGWNAAHETRCNNVPRKNLADKFIALNPNQPVKEVADDLKFYFDTPVFWRTRIGLSEKLEFVFSSIWIWVIQSSFL
jgi:hypothetical protein